MRALVAACVAHFVLFVFSESVVRSAVLVANNVRFCSCLLCRRCFSSVKEFIELTSDQVCTLAMRFACSQLWFIG